MSHESGSPRWIGILLFDVVEEIDAIGPWEVFAWWTAHFPDDGWRGDHVLGRRRPGQV